MRLLLLLTALFTALTGVVTGASASPHAVQASASVEQTGVSPSSSIAPLLLRAEQRMPPLSLDRFRAHVPAPQDGDTFGERRRE